MDDLETLLAQACERGMTHLTLAPVPSADGKTTYWAARATPSTNHMYVAVNDKDPIVALRGVLLGLPKAGRRTAAKKEKVTAPVTLDENERDQLDPACDWMLKP